MVKLVLTQQEYEALLFMMGQFSNETIRTNGAYAKKVLQLFLSIISKKEDIADPITESEKAVSKKKKSN